MMTAPVFRTCSLVPRGGPGLTCDDAGLALGPVVLAKKIRDVSGVRQYRLLSLDGMEDALRLAYGPASDAITERRCRGIVRVSQLLEGGEDALARIYAVLIGFPEIPPDGMIKLAAAASLSKDNPDWEDEPRVPAGNPDGGQWTSEGDDADPSAVTEVDFSEGFHDEVVDAWVKAFNDSGTPAVKAVGLRMVGTDGSIIGYPDILLRAPSLPVEAIEVKTGVAPTFTANQVWYLPMLQLGNHLYTNDPRIGKLRIAAGSALATDGCVHHPHRRPRRKIQCRQAPTSALIVRTSQPFYKSVIVKG
jgi:hypothetical protein